ncbi:MAG: sulfatase-like hydrolase/transferase [Woeseiaceae bacterium]
MTNLIVRIAAAAVLSVIMLPTIGSAQITVDSDIAVDKPNVLLIIGDDMGNEAFSCYGLNDNPAKTPTLDELCEQGVRFDNFWSQPICTPTRATMLTGRYAFRTGVGRPTGDRAAMGYFPDPPPKPVSAPAEPPRSAGGGPRRGPNRPTDWGLSLTEFALPMAFKVNKQLGYKTAAIGKWHVADRRNGWEDHPNLIGFDHFSGLIRGFPDSFFTWNKVVNGEWSGKTGYTPKDKTDDAIQWISEQEDNPWFLWFAFNLAHTPLHLPPEDMLYGDYSDVDKQANPGDDPLMYFDAMLEAMDSEIARLLASLAPGERDNTYVIFMGDNGSDRRNVRPPIEATKAKGSVYQGGVNVPLIVTGPGVVSGGVSKALVNSTDMYTTILEMAGIDVEDTVPEKVIMDAVSFMPYLSNPELESVRKYVYADTFTGNFAGIPDANFAMRNSQYKLLRVNGVREFYNLNDDPWETENLLERKLSEEELAHYTLLSKQVIALRSSH